MFFRIQIWFAFFALLGVQSGLAQTYQPLRCSGPIPADFRTLSVTKFEQDKSDEKKAKTAREEKNRDEFLLNTNYLIDDLLLSGKVLFGDPVTVYVNQIADRVLADQPELREKLRFYCLKSPQANAFCTDQGIIFVTLGLIAQLENEAQLAFVLSHEISHYEKRHTLNSYLEQEAIFSDNQSYKYNSYEDRIAKASTYSKSLELDADSLGLIRLSRTSYSCEEALNSLFVLQFSHLPFNEIVFKFDAFENSLMKIPDALQLDSIAAIDFSTDEEDDKFSTHPNMATRRKRMETQLAALNNCGLNKFVGSSASFDAAQLAAREEVIRLQLLDRNYVDAFYNAYVMLETDSQNIHAQTFMAKALYGMAKYSNAGLYSDISTSYKKIEGESQRAAFFFRQLEPEQLHIIALRFLFDVCKQNPSPTLMAMRDDLCSDLIFMQQINLERLSEAKENYITQEKSKKDTLAVAEQKNTDTKQDDPEEKKYVSKYDKLRKDKKEQEVVKQREATKEEVIFHLLAFADVLDDPELKNMFASAQIAADMKADLAAEKEGSSKKMSEYEYRKQQKQQKKQYKKGEAPNLGIDSVVFVDPFFFEVDERKGLRLVKSEAKLLQFSQQIGENASLAGLNYQILDPKKFAENEVDRFNDMAAINDWIGERLDHEEVEMIPLESEYATPVAEKYGTDHFCYTGVFSYKQQRENRGSIILVSILYFPILPFGIYYAMSPIYETNYYTLVYNVKTGKQEMSHVVTMKSKSKKGYLDSQMYDVMKRMKNKKRNTKKK